MGNKRYRTAEEVRNRAEEAIGHPFEEIFELARKFQKENGLKEKHGKGDIGQSFEEGWFNYACNNVDKPDFEEAKVELKVTPYLINSKGYRAKERLTLGKINYKEENWEEYEKSRFWVKNRHLIIMYYKFMKNISRKEYCIKKVDEILLEELPERDKEIIRHDWEKIAETIKQGRAHELSERDFMYLSPARKGHGGDETVKYDERYPKAKPRAYSFKASYMTKLFNERMVAGKGSDSVLPEDVSLRDKGFDEVLLDTLKPYLGRTVESLKAEFPGLRKGYSIKNEIIKRIFNSTCDLEQTDEFQKANYRFRTITIDNLGMPREDMSFSAFDFNALVEEEWEESVAFEEMIDSKFLLAIFSEGEDGKEILNNCMIWYIPDKDIVKVKEVWEETRRIINSGIELKQCLTHDKQGNPGFAYKNNFPKSNFNGVSHVRNKAAQSEYFKETVNSVRLGEPAKIILLEDIPDELKDAETPTGEYMTKQCFWFNKKYIKNQIIDYIRKY